MHSKFLTRIITFAYLNNPISTQFLFSAGPRPNSCPLPLLKTPSEWIRHITHLGLVICLHISPITIKASCV